MNDQERRIRTLHELPQSLEPARDLWPRIEARLQDGAATRAGRPWRARLAPAWRFAAAAALALLAVGVTLELWRLHDGKAAPTGTPAAALAAQRPATSPAMVPVVAQPDAAARAALLRSLNARLQALPPPTQQKVRADVQLIERSIQDIQAALGRDPGNALLHEMLRETEQDEQHLAATVQEAGAWAEEASGTAGRVGS